MTNEQRRKSLCNKRLMIVPYMHGDWAWCHTRKWHSLRYIAVIEDVLDILEKHPEYHYKWYMDCYVTVLKPFIEQRPELLERLARQIYAGNIAICGGFSNVRPNMVGDEAYVRNLTLGRKRFLEQFPGAKITVHADSVDTALGHPQIPQLISNAGFAYYRAGRPYEVLAHKGYKRAFIWRGYDGTEVPVWWGEYGGMWTEERVNELNRVDVPGWNEYFELFYDKELAQYISTTDTDAIWIGQGCDDSLPLMAYNRDLPLKLPEIIKRWNESEAVPLEFATPDEFFARLEVEHDRLPVYSGALDICDVSYNIAWGGEKGLIALRLTGSEKLAAAERMMSAAALISGFTPRDTAELWEKLLTANAHATAWLYQRDFDEIMNMLKRAHYGAGQLRGEAERNILKRINTGKNTIYVAFNASDIEYDTTLTLTLPSGFTDSCVLRDGFGNKLEYQPLYPYECSGAVWEQEIALRVTLPANGYTALSVENAPVDCRLGAVYTPPVKPETYGAERPFTLDNGLLRLEFEGGALVRVFDCEAGAYVGVDGDTAWNQLRYEHIDTDNYGLHAGPVIGTEIFRAHDYTITEAGPVSRRCVINGRLDNISGSSGNSGDSSGGSIRMEISLAGGSRAIDFKVGLRADESKNRGRFVCAIPVARDSETWGGIPFGIEQKDTAAEPYTDGEWVDYHRMYKGLFVSKDFACCNNGTHTLSLASRSGDRYFIRDTDKNELAYILSNSFHRLEDTWEQHINELIEFGGDHRFEYRVTIDSSDMPVYRAAANAAAYRLPVTVYDPVRTLEAASLPSAASFVKADRDNIRISTLCYENGDYICRLYESGGFAVDVTLDFITGFASAEAEDFIGNLKVKPVAVEGNRVSLRVAPFEIVTLRLKI